VPRAKFGASDVLFLRNHRERNPRNTLYLPMSVLVVILPLLHALVLPHQAVRNVVTLSVRPRALSPFMGAVRKV